MRPGRSAVRLTLAVVSGAAALTCGFADVFRPAGPEAVTITYVGDTILRRDSTVPFRVVVGAGGDQLPDRKSTRLNSSHGYISYAVFCLKKKKTNQRNRQAPLLNSVLQATAHSHGLRSSDCGRLSDARAPVA